MKSLLEVKKAKRAKNPHFLRSDAHKKVRIKTGWRKPNGHHNKMRLSLRGYRQKVRIGFGTPASLRNYEISGLRKVIVRNMAELLKTDPKKDLAVIANIGMKKKLELVKEAIKKKITLSNVKNPEEFLKQAEEARKKRAEEKTKEAASKKDKEKTKEKPKEEQKKKEEAEEKELTPEEMEEKERREKEKLLIKKQ